MQPILSSCLPTAKPCSVPPQVGATQGRYAQDDAARWGPGRGPASRVRRILPLLLLSAPRVRTRKLGHGHTISQASLKECSVYLLSLPMFQPPSMQYMRHKAPAHREVLARTPVLSQEQRRWPSSTSNPGCLSPTHTRSLPRPPARCRCCPRTWPPRVHPVCVTIPTYLHIWFCPPPPSPLSLLSKDVATIVRASARQLRDKSAKTRVGVFGVLRQLVAVRPGDMAGQVDALAPGLLAALNVGAGGAAGWGWRWGNGDGGGDCTTRSSGTAGQQGIAARLASLKLMCESLTKPVLNYT